ncbi:CHRD domain-containing protein [Sphingomonas quercus]|uniref:CHRD domain-containing protein n=1 Tax=Sphingomonas quercus TaxID=2842451 RepID=A0ABS6BI66_9SPHN|nr:CHRD domain-containing protein [Sphingomonas quercus]MBU3078003.1 CHRD domain-containing protein [Sphingomonas quercus]
MKPWYLASAALLSAAAAQPAAATVLVYETNLGGAAEAPPNASPGTGSAMISYDDVARTMRVQVTFQDLLATTTASHIHVLASPAAATGAVVTQTPTFPDFPLGVTAGSYDRTFDMTLASSYNPSFLSGPVAGGSVAVALDYLLQGLADGRAYLNVHSAAFPGGEIRGTLLPAGAGAVPEPASWALMIAGFGVAGVALRRGRRALAL